MKTLQSKLQEIKQRADNATEGPWKTDGDWCVCDKGGTEIVSLNYMISGRDESEFIAHSRTDIPALLAVIEKLIEQRNICEQNYIDACGIAEFFDHNGNISKMNAELLEILEGRKT